MFCSASSVLSRSGVCSPIRQSPLLPPPSRSQLNEVASADSRLEPSSSESEALLTPGLSCHKEEAKG